MSSRFLARQATDLSFITGMVIFNEWEWIDEIKMQEIWSSIKLSIYSLKEFTLLSQTKICGLVYECCWVINNQKQRCFQYLASKLTRKKWMDRQK